MNQRLTSSQSDDARPLRKGVLLLALAVLLLTQGGLRLYMISRSEVIAKDGVYFLGITKDILADPVAAMDRHGGHPGYPVATIGMYGLMRGGQFDLADRRGWERAGLAVALAASLLLLVGVWVFAGLIFGNWRIGFVAAMLFGFGGKFAALGADVLTDSLMLCLQIWAISLALAAANSLSRKSWWGLLLAAGVGGLAGGAFLVRPEGLVVLGIAILLWLAVQARRRINWKLCLAMTAVAAVTAFAVMWPYMWTIGTLTKKWQMYEFASSLPGGGVAGFPTCLAAAYPVEYSSVVRIIGRFFEAQHPVLAGLTCAYILLWLLGRTRRLRGLAEIIPRCSGRGVFVVVVTWILIVPLLALRYQTTGAMSHRYLMLSAALMAGFGAAGLVSLVRIGILPLKCRRPGLGRYVLPAVVVGLSLGLLLHAAKPLHGNKKYFKEAGLWLADQTGPDDLVLVDHRYIEYYSQADCKLFHELEWRKAVAENKAASRHQFIGNLLRQNEQPITFIAITEKLAANADPSAAATNANPGTTAAKADTNAAAAESPFPGYVKIREFRQRKKNKANAIHIYRRENNRK